MVGLTNYGCVAGLLPITNLINICMHANINELLKCFKFSNYRH